MKNSIEMALISLLCGVALPNMAFAQDTSATEAGLDAESSEIVVTAQRREGELSKTPVAVSVLTADALAKAQVVSEQDLQHQVAGLTVRGSTASDQLNYALRGQSRDAFSDTRPGVLAYFNEVQVRGTGASSAFYDLQSVQVLKGPQGTLFGRSATGGAVLFTSAKPTAEFGGYASASYGNYDNLKLEGALNVPIADDKLMGRIAGFYQSRNGFQKNAYDGRRVGDFEKYGARGSVTANLGETVRNELVLDYYRSSGGSTTAIISGIQPFDGSGPPYVPAALLYSGTATPAATLTGVCTLQAFVGLAPCGAADPGVAAYYSAYFADPNHPAGGLAQMAADQQARGPFRINTNFKSINRSENYLLTNITAIDISDNSQIKSTFGYGAFKSFLQVDSDGTPYNLITSALKQRVQQVSEELQILGSTADDRFNYVAGFYFADERVILRNAPFTFDLIFGGIQYHNDSRLTDRTYAGYGQGTYKLTDTGLSLTLGARYTIERNTKHNYPTDTSRISLGNPAPAGVSYDKSRTDKNFSWSTGLQYQLSPQMFTYVNARRAYKAGGFNVTVAPRIGLGGNGGDGYLPESVTDVELGFKYAGTVGQMPFRANIAVYHDWGKDSQHVAYSIVNFTPATVTVNVPKTTVRGIEADVYLRPAPWLTIGGQVSITDPKFKTKELIVNNIRDQYDRVTDTPKKAGAVYADLTLPLNDSVDVVVHGDTYAQSKVFTSAQSENIFGTVLPGYAIANFRLSLENKAAGWTVAANLRNAFNRVYYVGGLPVGQLLQLNTRLPGDPRTFTVEARMKF